MSDCPSGSCLLGVSPSLRGTEDTDWVGQVFLVRMITNPTQL